MAGQKGKSGGARNGAGRLQRRVTLSGPAAIYVRELTRARLGRKDVTPEELSETLEQVLQDYAARNPA